MLKQPVNPLTSGALSSLGEKLPDGLFIERQRVVDRLYQSASTAQYWHLPRELMTEAVDRPDIERRVVQSPLFVPRVINYRKCQRSGLTLVFRGDRHVLTGLLQLLHDPERHFARCFACKCNGQHLLRPIHSRQQRQQSLCEQLGFSRARGRTDTKAPCRIDRFPPDNLV